MKRHVLLATVTALTVTASADFTGITCEEYVGEGWNENGYTGLTTYRIYALVDDPSDHFVAVTGENPNCFSATPSGDVFHNDDLLDSETAPLDLRPVIWHNQWDTYLTIGTDTAEGDQTSLTPGFREIIGHLEGTFLTYYGGYFITPKDEQGAPIDGRVLIMQLVVPEGDTVTGTLNAFTVIAGELEQSYESFACGVLDCNANGIPDSVEIEKGQSQDCDGDGVPDKCQDEEPCLRADLDCSGVVGFQDILQILSGWGPCGLCPNDIDEDGRVGFSDLLYVLSHHGVCPE